MTDFDSSVRSLKGIGEKRARLFESLGVFTVGDLLRFYPRGYQDFSAPSPIAACRPGEDCCIRGVVLTPVRRSPVRPGMTLFKTAVEDDTGRCELTFFNNPYIADLLRAGEAYVFTGRMGGSLLRHEMASPDFEPAASGPGLLPVYPATEGLNSRAIRSAASQALAACGEIADPLPDTLRSGYALCHLRFALENIHFPPTHEALETARRRLVFEELLALQLGMLLLRGRTRAQDAPVCTAAPDFPAFFATLPFEPTEAQRRAVAEAAEDMRTGRPMNRLLEGDVGSGKTVVAAALCRYAALCGLQSALMAPTEILAIQHWRTLTDLLLKSGVNVGLLTGGMKAAERRRTREMLAARALDVVVGTHALLQEDVGFERLGLVITDEQHRFGVGQRAVLAAKGPNPHVLIMSATPIPRTLALMIYGELDISVLDVLPRGRQPVKTYVVDSGKRARVYDFIRRHLDRGLQAYIVCPLVEQGDSSLAAAEEYAAALASGEFRAYRVGVLHGRLSPAQKERIMGGFSRGELQLLVSTTVVEVGVDVPNAAVMVVENAERFGLSQLHQLRGRVGRGTESSSCILISDTASGETAKRLAVMRETTDGFKIAERDLELRGPGDFFGSRQHGLPELKLADLSRDMSLFAAARACALEVLERDPELHEPANTGLLTMTRRLFSGGGVVFN